MKNAFLRKFFSGDLDLLAAYYKTDKRSEMHNYASIYQQYFNRLRMKPVRLLEIGVGGDNHPGKGGASLRMWRDFFYRGMVYGIDQHPKRFLDEKRIRTYQGKQEDLVFLNRTLKEIGALDIVIDDGGHINSHVIKSFQTIFPLMSPEGIYAIEDIQTSYWPGLGGDSRNLSHADTVMGYFKGLTDGLNYRERINPGYMPTYFDQNIKSIHFYHNMIFIIKGKNDQGSLFIQDNQTHLSWIQKDVSFYPK